MLYEIICFTNIDTNKALDSSSTDIDEKIKKINSHSNLLTNRNLINVSIEELKMKAKSFEVAKDCRECLQTNREENVINNQWTFCENKC